MRRLSIFVLIFLAACQVWLPHTPEEPSALPATSTATDLPPSPQAPTSGPESRRAFPPPEKATATLPALDDAAFTVRLHPDGPLYVGDQVSFEVIAPAGPNLQGRSVQLTSKGAKIAEAQFGSYGIAGRQEAVLNWAWDTSSLIAGEYALTFSITPDGPTWTQSVRLGPRGQIPPPEPQAAWASARSQCCTVYYITGTAAGRDLPSLLAMIDEQAQKASQEMGIALSGDKGDPVEIVLLPRVLGHGGFASKNIAVSYLDRNYMGGDVETILHHEMVHILDSRLGGGWRPSMLVEGLAVYKSGGHFRPESILPRAAALLPAEVGCQPWSPSQEDALLSSQVEGCGLDFYVPLATLLDHFYFEQHEAGYLEAAALIQFMVQTWGREAFSAFYRDIHLQEQGAEGEKDGFGPQARAVDAALYAHFGLTLRQLEERFLAALRQEHLSPENAEDVRLAVRFYDLARLYQLTLDPSAYFMTAWLPDNEEMRKRNITADYLRYPSRPENLALETLLVSANSSMAESDFARAGQLLTSLETVLDAYPEKSLQAFNLDPLVADYLALVEAAQAAGCQPQHIALDDSTARVWASECSSSRTPGPQITLLDFIRHPEGWTMRVGSGWLNPLWVSLIADQAYRP